MSTFYFMKKIFYFLIFSFSLSLSSEKDRKKILLGGAIGASSCILSTILRAPFKEWQGTKPILKNLTSINFLSHIKTIKLFDLAYITTCGAHLNLSNNENNDKAKKPTLWIWGLMSLAKAIKETKEIELRSCVKLLTAGVGISKCCTSSFKDKRKANREEKEEEKKNNLQKGIGMIPGGEYKKIYLSLLFWAAWQLHKEKSICINEKSIFNFFEAYKLGLFIDIIENGSHKNTSLAFTISDFLSKLPEESYSIESSLKELGQFEGTACLIKNFF